MIISGKLECNGGDLATGKRRKVDNYFDYSELLVNFAIETVDTILMQESIVIKFLLPISATYITNALIATATAENNSGQRGEAKFIIANTKCSRPSAQSFA